MKLYRITNWNENFENNRTRDLKRLDWVPIPNRMDNDGYTELLNHPNGPAHFGVWIACVEVASRCDPRGTLLRRGNLPHDFDSLARFTRIPAALIYEAVRRLVGINWIQVQDVDSAALTEISQEGATLGRSNPAPACGKAPMNEGNEGKGREGKESSCGEMPPALTAKQPPVDPPPVLVFPCDGKARSWNLTQAHIAEWQLAYPSLDILAEARKALAWINANPGKRKTHDGMPRFLNSWLGRSQNDASKSGSTKGAHNGIHENLSL